MNEIDFKLSKKQGEFLEALKSKKYKYLCYGGAAGGGKSYLGCFIIVACALQYSDTRYAIVRKNLTVLKRTSMITLKKVLKQLQVHYSFNGSDLKFTLDNGSEIHCIEADTSKDKELLKLAGFEATGILIEQADEVDELVFSISIVRKGRENANKVETSTGKTIDQVPEFVLLTTNPTQNWLKEKFYLPKNNGELKPPYYYLSALATDNPFNTKDYIASLHDLPEAQRRQFLYGDWDYADDPHQLINYAWINNCLVEEEFHYDDDLDRYLGVDVARYGDDITVFCFMQDNELYSIKTYNNQDTVKTAELAEFELRDQNIKANRISVDVIGLGAGVVDTLVSKGYKVTEFNSADKPTGTQGYFKFANKRAEAYWLLREDFKNGNIAINKVNIKTQEILRQLTQIRYFTKGDKIYIESKDDIKKRLGRSPDEADALAIVNYKRHYTGQTIEILTEDEQSFVMPTKKDQKMRVIKENIF